MIELYVIIIGLLLAIFLPQMIKTVTDVIKTGKIRLSQFFIDGGMPSAHSSFVSALSTATIISEGFSMLTLVVLSFSLVIIRDAFGIRLEVGKQKEVLEKLHPKERLVAELKREGHTILQVSAGILFGIVTMILSFKLL
ncbi:divergent PAP2 family protein [archaeon]|jgi:uncharacterized protein|nr:divergent PAP2 family protein [archaeon]